jgi:hypothetical protein
MFALGGESVGVTNTVFTMTSTALDASLYPDTPESATTAQ